MSYVVIGVDPAAQRLAAVITAGDDFYVETRTMPKDDVLRCKAAFTWLTRLIREYGGLGQVAVFVEEPVLGRGGAGGTLPIARIQGALITAAAVSGVDAIERVHPSKWKKQIVGHGGADKPMVAAHVQETWPAVYAISRTKGTSAQDVCDAACINRYGVKVLKLRAKMKRIGNVAGGRKQRGL